MNILLTFIVKVLINIICEYAINIQIYQNVTIYNNRHLVIDTNELLSLSLSINDNE